MCNLIELSAGWREAMALLSRWRSVAMIAPRYYDKWSTLRQWAKEPQEGQAEMRITLSSRAAAGDGGVDYRRLWELVRGDKGARNKQRVEDRASFVAALEERLHKMEGHCIFIIGGAGRGYEELHYDVVATFHTFLATQTATIIACDDYSSFYFQKLNYLLSDLHSLKQVQIGPVGEREIDAYIADVGKMDSVAEEYRIACAREVWLRSGGHIGIAQEIVLGLQQGRWPHLGSDWQNCVEGVLRRSAVLESIGRALEEDADGYSSTALEYETAACPEQNSPRIHVLRQLGVLHRERAPLLRLCGGAITDLVKTLSRGSSAAKAKRIGTIVSEAGPRVFEAGPVNLTDDDIVVLHLSDLHVGEHYKHRLTWRGGQLNPNEQFAGDLLKDDLEALGMLGRVDAMVLSGDFVWNGSAGEFSKAIGALEEMLKVIGLDLSRTLLVPGNHDVEWNAGGVGSKSLDPAGSRDRYDDFIRLLGKPSPAEAEILMIPSRSKKNRLLIVGLDSNKVEGPQAAGIGFVSRDGLSAARRAIADFRRSDPTGNAAIWLVVHHHIFPATSASLTDAQGRMVSIMANAAEILELANRDKVEAILHGHEHQPSVTVARRWPFDDAHVFLPVVSVGAGSFGVKREHLGPFSRNHYYVIIRRPDGILIRSREQGGGGVRFVPHSDMWLPRP
jgi:3',5'-cyclic AMP phosphodiesterase CpdA